MRRIAFKNVLLVSALVAAVASVASTHSGVTGPAAAPAGSISDTAYIAQLLKQSNVPGVSITGQSDSFRLKAEATHR